MDNGVRGCRGNCFGTRTGFTDRQELINLHYLSDMLKVVDAQLGPLHITWRRGARHISFRPLRTGEGFSITIPAFVSAKGYQSIVEQLRPRLLVLKAEREKLSPVCLLTPSCHLDVPDFSLSWQSYTGHLIR